MMRKMLLAALAVSALVAAVPAQTAADEPPGGAMTQASAESEAVFIGEYVTWDRANQVVQQYRSRGYDAWIVHWGSIIYGSRTYAVFVR